jgi:hypothetical protein
MRIWLAANVTVFVVAVILGVISNEDEDVRMGSVMLGTVAVISEVVHLLVMLWRWAT